MTGTCWAQSCYRSGSFPLGHLHLQLLGGTVLIHPSCNPLCGPMLCLGHHSKTHLWGQCKSYDHILETTLRFLHFRWRLSWHLRLGEAAALGAGLSNWEAPGEERVGQFVISSHSLYICKHIHIHICVYLCI